MEKVNPPLVLHLLMISSLWIIFIFSGATDAALVNNIRISPSLFSLLNTTGTITINGSSANINMTVAGLGNLTTQQQQVVASLLLRSLLPGGASNGYPFDLGGLGYQYGYNVGDFLGTSGPAAAAAAAYTNPLGILGGYQNRPPVVTTSLFPFQNLISGPAYGSAGSLFGYAPSTLGALLASPNASPLYTYNAYPSAVGGYSGVLGK